MKLIGLMSGTSMDGIDAALLEIGEGNVHPAGRDPGLAAEGSAAPPWRLVAFRNTPYDDERRRRLREAVDRGDPEALCRLHAALGSWLAEAVGALLEEAGVGVEEVAALGSHGHTVRHDPPVPGGPRGATLQLGDAATLAEETGLPVIHDFRAADVAAGGHGAPLVPWPDRLMFALQGRRRALQNLGGIGNVTWLAPRESDQDPVAFDTGPGNVLLDLAAERASGGRMRLDEDGRMALRGEPDETLVARLLEHPFFRTPPPRSTGREAFGPELVDRLTRERGLEPGGDQDGWADLLATLTRFTARSVGDAYRRWILPRGLDEVVITGGGARNPAVVRRIREELEGVVVHTGADALGMDPDAREAAAFAVLAWAFLRGVPANVPSVTGARGPRVLGSWTPAPRPGRPRPGMPGPGGPHAESRSSTRPSSRDAPR